MSTQRSVRSVGMRAHVARSVVQMLRRMKLHEKIAIHDTVADAVSAGGKRPAPSSTDETIPLLDHY